MAGHKANIRKLITEKPWHKRPKILPILAQQPLLQAPVVHRHVVVEQHLGGEPVLEPLGGVNPAFSQFLLPSDT